MKFTVVIASLLGVFLAPGLANWNRKTWQPNHPLTDIGVITNAQESSGDWKSVWDFASGYAATKVFSRNTCIISKMDRRAFLPQEFPAAPQGDEGFGPQPLPPGGNHFFISSNRLQSLRPYGKRIQALCRGIPSYLAYPAAGSNFLMQDVACLKVDINQLPVYYCH
ncbi:gastrokine-1-like [Calypte anna]|uniref:gastrokine-1-like n=1 Tax=Calypte anna TaxID=9244 RepID=UPI0011C3A8DD|nr:gastrokine-1-like [Calypte anna]